MAKGDGIKGDSVFAGITNVALAMRAMERAVSRPQHLPGMVGFFGDSGLGKSFAAAYTANHFRAYYIECREAWSKKAFLLKLVEDMGISKPGRTVAELTDQAAMQLADSQRPLIVDEADKPVDHGYIEIIRDLHEAAGGAPILLIGEEALEVKLRPFERFHNRMLEWVPAQPASMDDAKKLATLYCPGIKVADDLLTRVLDVSRGVTRRICVNLSRVAEFAALEAPKDNTVTLAMWGTRELSTGEARRRHA
ncbi:MAG TPA: AAA family ATPase [Nevskiaceae bacterium]|nr:AAA family ATPase [Nevskiaceae bacterium]